jgi:hypothetical protein
LHASHKHSFQELRMDPSWFRPEVIRWAFLLQLFRIVLDWIGTDMLRPLHSLLVEVPGSFLPQQLSFGSHSALVQRSRLVPQARGVLLLCHTLCIMTTLCKWSATMQAVWAQTPCLHACV